MSGDQMPLLPGSPRYDPMIGPFAQHISLAKPTANGDVDDKRLKIPKGCDICWTQISVSGPSQKPTTFREKFLSRRSQKRCEILHKVEQERHRLLNVLTSRNLSGLDVSGFVTVDGSCVSKWRMKE
ncbi:hypothetical protein OSTOST_11893, partial [Ostertagia ostertagi]